MTFILAADPNRRFTGRITNISRATELNPDEGQSIRVTVEFDSKQLDVRQVRTDVQAKIYCGRASLGYVWLHDVFEFVDRKVLFWLW